MKDVLEQFSALLNQQARWCFLVGAGVSTEPPSNLPAGIGFVSAILGRVAPDAEMLSSLMRLVEPDRPDFLRFEAVMLCLADSVDPRLEVLGCFGDCDRPNANHYTFAALAQRGHSVITTNFDRLIELAGVRMSGAAESTAVLSDDDFERCLATGSFDSVVKIHGSLRRHDSTESRDSVRATLHQVGRGGEGLVLNPAKQKLLTAILQSRP